MSDRTRKRLRAIVAVLASAALVLPAAAWAADRFTDVPDSNIFHDDIDWMADSGVTRGCNPPDNTEYCPDENVTREQMAAFLHRLDTENVFVSPEDDAVDGGNADELDGLDSSAFARTENFHPYFVTIDGTDPVTIAEFGPFTVLGRCDPGSEVALVVTSSVADWYEEEGSNPLAADAEEEVLVSTSTDDVDQEYDAGFAISENAAGDTLHYLGYDGESTLLGLGIFDHDCVIGGTLQMNTTAK